jgi:hypothetical protein
MLDAHTIHNAQDTIHNAQDTIRNAQHTTHNTFQPLPLRPLVTQADPVVHV